MNWIEHLLGLARRADDRYVPFNGDGHRTRNPQDQIAEMESRGELYFDCGPRLPFRATHRHVKTGGLYMVTDEGRLEVTGDDGYLLVEYENEAGQRFAQAYDRFHDGRFEVLK